MPHCRLRFYVDSASTRAWATAALLRQERIAKKKRASIDASPWVIRLTFWAPWRLQSRSNIPTEDVNSKPAGTQIRREYALDLCVISSQPAPTGADTSDSAPSIRESLERCGGARDSHIRGRDRDPGDARDWCRPIGSGPRPSPAPGSWGSDHQGSWASARPPARAGPGSLAQP